MIAHASDVDVVVVLALPDRAIEIAVRLPAGSTVAEVLKRSGLAALHPDVDPMRGPVGIFGKLADRATSVADGDRVEVYRPLIADPKQRRIQAAARRQRRPQ